VAWKFGLLDDDNWAGKTTLQLWPHVRRARKLLAVVGQTVNGDVRLSHGLTPTRYAALEGLDKHQRLNRQATKKLQRTRGRSGPA